MTISVTELRKNLFSILDDCLDKGTTVEVRRRNGAIRITPAKRRCKIRELTDRPGVLVDSDGLDSFSPSQWSGRDFS